MPNNKKNKVITIRLNDKQYNFLQEWKKDLEQQSHLEIPMATLIRRLINIIDPSEIKNRSKTEAEAELRIAKIRELLLNLNQEESKNHN